MGVAKDKKFLAGKNLGGADLRVESRLAVQVKPHKAKILMQRRPNVGKDLIDIRLKYTVFAANHHRQIHNAFDIFWRSYSDFYVFNLFSWHSDPFNRALGRAVLSVS
jgi:hypothetical protein